MRFADSDTDEEVKHIGPCVAKRSNVQTFVMGWMIVVVTVSASMTIACSGQIWSVLLWRFPTEEIGQTRPKGRYIRSIDRSIHGVVDSVDGDQNHGRIIIMERVKRTSGQKPSVWRRFALQHHHMVAIRFTVSLWVNHGFSDPSEVLSSLQGATKQILVNKILPLGSDEPRCYD